MLLSNQKDGPLLAEGCKYVNVNITKIDNYILSDNRRALVETKNQVRLDAPTKSFDVIFFTFVLTILRFLQIANGPNDAALSGVN